MLIHTNDTNIRIISIHSWSGSFTTSLLARPLKANCAILASIKRSDG